MKKFTKYSFVALFLAFTGCERPEPETRASLGVVQTTYVETNPVEVFVFVSAADRERTRGPFESLVLSGLPAESLVHLVAGDMHLAVASVNVPFGTPKTRIKNQTFCRQYDPVQKFFEQPVEAKAASQLSLPSVSETVCNLRRTNLECRVLLCGTPIFDDPIESTFSMAKGLVPSDALIDHPHSPWTIEPKLPANTRISWLVPNSRWGANAKQRKELTRFHRLYVEELGGHLIRITPDPNLAFSFAQPFLPNSVSRRDDEPAMRDPQVDTQLDQPDAKRAPVVVPVKQADVSFQPPGSLEYEIEMAGGNPEKLAGEAITLFLIYDGSGSMKAEVVVNNRTIERMAELLPPLVKSFEIGIAVHRHGSVNRFPITNIVAQDVDGGDSLARLAKFLASIRSSGNDAVMSEMLADGIQSFAQHENGKRQFLMIVADHAEFDSNNAAEFESAAKQSRDIVANWCNQTSTDRRFIAMYSGGTGPVESFFQHLGNSNTNSLFSRDPGDLVQALISAAIPCRVSEERHE